MRALVTVTVLGSVLVGCMALPEAEELVFLDDEREAMPELRAIPYDEAPPVAPPVEVAPEPEPADETEPEPAPRRVPTRPRFVADAPGPDACWGVQAEGFPAISDDGTTLVVPRTNHLQLQLSPGTMGLEWRDVASGHVTRSDPVVIFDESYDEVDERACGRVARGIRRRAHAVNANLAAVSWRVMERLPVALGDLGVSDEARAEYLAQVPSGERVVQLVARHGEVALRIPGVKVLERHPLPTDDVVAVYGDRVTGTVVLVGRECVGDSCTCDPSFTAYVLHWSPESFNAIAERPCVAAGEDVEEPPYEGATSCEAVEYEFDGVPWTMG
jgi:hypothetical protein